MAGTPLLITAPRISPRLREGLTALANDPHLPIERVYASLMKLEGYEALPPAIRDDIFQSVEQLARLWFRLLLTGSQPAEPVNAEIEESARRRVHQSVPLQALLRATQIGAREVWQASVEVAGEEVHLARELALTVAPFLFEFFEGIAQTLAQAYVEEQLHRANWREANLYQLHAAIFHSPDDHASFIMAMSALGLDASVPRIAIALDAGFEALTSEIRRRESERYALAVSRHFRIERETIVHVWHRGRAIFWLPGQRGDLAAQSDLAASQCAQNLVNAEARLRAVGVGLLNEGAAGWAASANEAIRAVEVSLRCTNGARVARYSDIALEETVRTAGDVTRYLVSLIEQIRADSDLLATLTAFYANGRRRRPTADALGIHLNTLNYRLERIEKMLGASLDDAQWIARLDLALKLAHGTGRE
ncbi:PucR family transcriptional regulator [Paraburkholderia sp. BR10937]|uniref:PucR family transcriptional regulator n=1 Tax=Paraburkholderia sp. BR10937 TaxID=3236994 RepID=UPI0034D1E2C1